MAVRLSRLTWWAESSEAFPNARVGNGFGLTECSSVATFLPHEYALLRPETVGFAAPVVDLKLKSVLPGTDVGDLLMRGPNVVPGYWNKPEATAETLPAAGCIPATWRGWTNKGSCRSSIARKTW